MKLTKKQSAAVFIILVSIATTAILSFGILWTHHPINREFFTLWRPDFISGCIISIPTGFLLNPRIKKMIDRYTDDAGQMNSVATETKTGRIVVKSPEVL